MAKYQKRAVVVDAVQVNATTAGNWGKYGTLLSGEWVIEITGGLIYTLPNSTFQTKYTTANESTALTGTDWD